MTTTREELRQTLLDLGVVHLTVDYSGSDDSGGINYLHTMPSQVPLNIHHKEIPHPWSANRTMKLSLEDQIKMFFGDMLDKHCSGFENNDGGKGDFEWDLANDKITLDHAYYVTELHHEATLEL